MPKITIIVPVYGAERYLYRCLDSIKAQTFTNWECILVDDGSKDRSGVICDEYAQKDSRFRVYHKENGGVSSARQYGMERMLESDSIYSIHADPDDWMEPDMLESLYQKAMETDADMVICDYFVNKKDKQYKVVQNPMSEKPLEVLGALFQRLHGSLWNKLIRTACYKNANAKFPIGLNYSEDFYVNVCLLQHMEKVAYLSNAYYHYDQYTNEISETRNLDINKIDNRRLEIVRRCREIVPQKLKTWQYYLFEVYHAYRIITKGGLDNRVYRHFFSSLPYSLLFHPHKRYSQTFFTYLAVYTPLGRNGVAKMLTFIHSLKN